MAGPAVVSRNAHTLSRQQIDADALKVLYRLHQNDHTAYLVGGGVRDLLLGRRPKDFDIGTSAQPQQVKKLFRNCWIIGRRFRLAHVRYGTKTIEVATFRRQLTADEQEAAAQKPADLESSPPVSHPGSRRRPHDQRENYFGSPKEDAFRRDFTVNALFYDIGTFSIIDFTGGLTDLEQRIIRCIGDPQERFLEDPVRMWRAVAMAARLGFRIDPPIDEAIALHRHALATSAPARLIEECYKLMRTGAAETAFRLLAERRLLEALSTELQEAAGDPLWQSLSAIDRYRRGFDDAPETLTNAILLGTFLVPMNHVGLTRPRIARKAGVPVKEPRLTLGVLPLARRDIERLRLILGLQRRLLDSNLPPRARLNLTKHSAFPEALTWLEIHGNAPEVAARWHQVAAAVAPADATDGAQPSRRRRRRRRRRGPVARSA